MMLEKMNEFFDSRLDGYDEHMLTNIESAMDKDEKQFRLELSRLKKEQGTENGEFYHYDTPLTVKNETDALIKAGFRRVEVLGKWGATHTLKAYK